ncbi:hypothetical protein VE01_04048 [Pseudogymnoascus verrucosus]|uniref:Uncharacterized protein n=1 Tax=Pseudogymnoascus verrucosus TaxID=342668 RepID=A0A1B8GQD2_9PEZI|nr:uncharacterized protein VE01_04048 [Pseudogymnoascus verrucosus]OBT98041.1 hypothetical protein VE01_04048 [Pseudogymnoascus verrucosus]
MSTSAHAKKYCSTELYRYEDHNFKFWFPNGPIIPEDKVISAIGSHPILAAYNKHLRPKVREALASAPWQTIGIVRLGFADNEDNPPVVLVTIKEENAEENIVQAAVDRIRNIMVENGFLDVQAEAKTGMLFPQLTYDVDRVIPLEFKQTPKTHQSPITRQLPLTELWFFNGQERMLKKKTNILQNEYHVVKVGWTTSLSKKGMLKWDRFLLFDKLGGTASKRIASG